MQLPVLYAALLGFCLTATYADKGPSQSGLERRDVARLHARDIASVVGRSPEALGAKGGAESIIVARAKSGSSRSSSVDSMSSTATSKHVWPDEAKYSADKNMRVLGVNGCTAIFLFGADFIVGAHANTDKIPEIIQKAHSEVPHGKTVTSLVVWAPDDADVNKAKVALHALYAHITPATHKYVMDMSHNPGDWEFDAKQGHPGLVSAKHIPG